MQNSYMQYALELARLGKGSVSPNPLVGAVLVHQDQVIGAGYHAQYGQAHAEVAAFEAAQQHLEKEGKSQVQIAEIFRASTLYVTLEPCAHFGKTPPCADLVVKKQVQKVVVATLDDNPLVGGKGIERIRAAGIEVEIGIEAQAARWQNRRFFKMITQKTPYLVLKWAQSKDGFLAPLAQKKAERLQISSAFSRYMVHQWRAEEDAILIGKNTALYDNPTLDVRYARGKNPLRIVVDRKCELPAELKVFDGSVPTIVYHDLQYAYSENIKNKFDFIEKNKPFPIKTVALSLLYPDQKEAQHDNIETNDKNKTEKKAWQAILTDLGQRNIQSLLVEGGAKILTSLIETELADEIRLFEAKELRLGSGISAPAWAALDGFDLKESYDFSTDKLYFFVRKQS
ncbi:bifunctional diaminohydroxyphosphoribosylaminopyrimidine deaminase/5-amino-6-(5-phosphoribosylamino)uracil reductase RibD [Hugenholtzia roseola]|uniref:bifunctional diaminohydroxyphosphoribosylaminopyrimidine deaminase/5-amino-6-(5-phosphoribosylamino)uracil reductase RibD n=1 Tax=Hugenholtzia roseola TaxID=1002 RepID=UPI00047DDA30|nr:bifunctional diaminohydroxyphosphoribosylaminopyrimidine deaminase/5-amino-6-(5-phosphoribosylamino)uracil reductase RibD [Hugenholtzia roseola]